jgi:hypothetical protein
MASQFYYNFGGVALSFATVFLIAILASEDEFLPEFL